VSFIACCKLLWLPYIVMGRPLCFTPVIYLFIITYFSRSYLRGRRTPPRDLCQDMGMWCHFITQFRGGPICILYILKGRKSVNLAPQLDDGATLNSCNLKTTLNIAKLTRTRLTTFLSNHNCQVSYTSAL